MEKREKKNKLFEFTEINYQFPRTIEVEYKKYEGEEFIRISESPFGNCQTFTIAIAYKLRCLSNREITNLFKEIFSKLNKKQLVIDLKDEYNELTLKALKHITKNVITIPYISTNDSHMNLNIIQLDIKKLE